MSKRLQVLMDEEELGLIREVAGRDGLSVAAWVRLQLKKALRRYPQADVERKVSVLREAVRHSYPTGDIDEINAQIATGYQDDAK